MNHGSPGEVRAERLKGDWRKADWLGLRHLDDISIESRRKMLRRRLLVAFGAGVVVIALLALGWWLITSAGFVSTDNAYVGADVAQITPEISGTVKLVKATDTEMVRRGDVLVTLVDTDAQLALAQAEADEARAVRRVGQYFANVGIAAAQVDARQADLTRSRSEYERRAKLAAKGTISPEELTAALATYDAARASLESAKGTLTAAQTLVQGTDVQSNPEVVAAKTAVGVARLNLERTELRAPVDGVVARRQVQVGQRIEPGALLMTVVPLADVHVDANFKEGQLRKVRAGQPARLISDLYGSDVVFHGRVVGIGGGTGSAFALIPAQNATGNWIKVVQRLPVRIALDPEELKAHPLRVGLSMTARVDIRR